MQEREHYIESKGIEKIKAWAERYGVAFEDVHDDFSTGVDIKLNGYSYDVKVTNSTWLTMIKKYKDKWYSPLELHQEVPYLILKGDFGYILDKKRLADYCFQMSNKSGIEQGVYTLDGNINITFNADKFMQCPSIDFTN